MLAPIDVREEAFFGNMYVYFTIIRRLTVIILSFLSFSVSQEAPLRCQIKPFRSVSIFSTLSTTPAICPNHLLSSQYYARTPDWSWFALGSIDIGR